MSMTVQCLEVGPLMANCYIIACEATRRGVVVDPGAEAPAILKAVEEARLDVDLVLNTHCHPDHTGANCAVRDGTGARLLIHSADRAAVESPPLQWLLVGVRPEPCPVDDTFEEGDELAVGELRLRVMHLPGHSPGGVAFLVGDAAFTGDTLFAGGIGRTDLPGGDHGVLMASLKRLVTELPPDTVVHPGHGPQSTIGREAAANEWLRGL